MTLETFVSQALTALECRYQRAQLETAVWEQMTASHMVLQETVTNALVSLAIMQNWQVGRLLVSIVTNEKGVHHTSTVFVHVE